ncbi:MAG: hypothetical protein KIT43_01410 [Bauldia sp.]|nr:hypothetical protein [Bauldia sp.]MCW5716214.1 hypothetical protein [Bauldia sp.]
MQHSESRASRPNPSPDENGYPAEKARQGYIVLRTPLRRWIFFGGLVGVVILLVVLRLLSL